MKDDPKAFPLTWEEENQHGFRFPNIQEGMSLRDWFAGQALAAIARSDINTPGVRDGTAAWAWDMADAMMRERDCR